MFDIVYERCVLNGFIKKMFSIDINKSKLLIRNAEVIAVSGAKTVKVAFFDTVLHKVGKYVKIKRVLTCHDDTLVCKIGDKVDVYSCRPISSKKSHFVKLTV